MGLKRCPTPECQRVLDVPEIIASWRCPDGRCGECNNILTKSEFEKMDLPSEVVRAVSKSEVTCGAPAFKVDCGVTVPPIRHLKKRKEVKQYKGEYPFDQLPPPKSNGQQYSFFVPCPPKTNNLFFANKIGIAARSYAVTFASAAKYTRRQVMENDVVGVRIWRTA